MDNNAKSSIENSSDIVDAINKFKAILVNNRLILKSQVVKQNKLEKIKAKKSFQTRQASIVEGKNPAHIFGLPNEIWEVVFEQFDDTTDIQNCYDTCQQFRSSCSSTQRTLLQIRKMLPILFGTGYLTHNQILNLRLTSKAITKLVDQFFQSKKLSWHDSSAPIEYDLIPHFYNCPVLEIQDTDRNISKGHAIIRKQILSHPQTRNPFISRYVKIHDTTRLTSETYPLWHDQVIGFLKIWGEQIWYLNLALKCSKAIFIDILKQLPNLKHLELSGCIGEYGCGYHTDCSKLLKETCPQLTCLVLPYDTQYISTVHDHLISGFSDQLQEIHVNIWGELHFNFDWSNLRKLVVSHFDDLGDLARCRAINVNVLSLGFWDTQNFDLFLSIVKTFPSLKSLQVLFGTSFEMGEKEVIKKLMEDNNMDSGFCNVKKLSIRIPITDHISLDFLAWFPMLEYLEIDKVFFEEDTIFIDFDDEGEIDLDDFNVLYRNRNVKTNIVELIEIREFLLDYKEINLEKSNVWKVFPFLKQIKVRNLGDDTDKKFVKPFGIVKH